ncbi:MAG: YraN family protein [Candidatus Moranbacteria bacterium]|nr:YraN family protein [Candidatus Moranbacteria bacterium]
MIDFCKKQIQSLGQFGEKTAILYLKKIGYKLVCTNFTNLTGRRIGEIDIIMKDKNELVFIEVKTRKKTLNQKTITPEENIGRQKLHKMEKIVNYYLKLKNLWDQPYRFDAVSLIYNEKTNQFKIKHIKNIFL